VVGVWPASEDWEELNMKGDIGSCTECVLLVSVLLSQLIKEFARKMMSIICKTELAKECNPCILLRPDVRDSGYNLQNSKRVQQIIQS
jgi:hypothetical protein